MTHGPCAKTRVRARLIASDGRIFDGANDCRRPVTVCPRIIAGSGRDDYRLCGPTGCDQPGHAEIMALKAAGRAAKGGTMLIGHWRACDACQAAMRASGVAQWECVAPDDPRLG